MKRTTVFATVGIVVVLVAFIVASSAGRKLPNLEGRYAVKVEGKDTGIALVVEQDRSTMTFRFAGPADVSATFQIPLPESRQLIVLEDTNRSARYELKVTKRGMEGRAWVIPVGQVDVLFERAAQ